MKKLEIYKFITIKYYWNYDILKMGTTKSIKLSSITSKVGKLLWWKDLEVHESTEAMGFMRSFFHYYTQITPLENTKHTVWMDYKQKIPKFARNDSGNGFYEVTNQLLGKWGPHSLNGLLAKKIEICTKTLRKWVLIGPYSIITHKSPPWKYKQNPKFAGNHWVNGFYEVAFPLLGKMGTTTDH